MHRLSESCLCLASSYFLPIQGHSQATDTAATISAAIPAFPCPRRSTTLYCTRCRICFGAATLAANFIGATAQAVVRTLNPPVSQFTIAAFHTYFTASSLHVVALPASHSSQGVLHQSRTHGGITPPAAAAAVAAAAASAVAIACRWPARCLGAR